MLENTNIPIAYVPAEAFASLFIGTKISNNAMLYQQPADFVQHAISPRKARMRSIKQAIEMLKNDDPDTAITPYCIRQLCKKNAVHHRTSGKKVLIDYDDLLNYFNAREAC